jgi:hypothetical protein
LLDLTAKSGSEAKRRKIKKRKTLKQSRRPPLLTGWRHDRTSLLEPIGVRPAERLTASLAVAAAAVVEEEPRASGAVRGVGAARPGSRRRRRTASTA